MVDKKAKLRGEFNNFEDRPNARESVSPSFFTLRSPIAKVWLIPR